MKNCFLVMSLALILGVVAVAQKANSTQAVELPPQTPIYSPAELSAKVPPAKVDDVKSMHAILHAMYDVISGPAGDRDWKRFRSIFLPQARFTQVGKGPDGATFIISWNVDEFVRDAGEVFSKQPFFENAIVNDAQSYGNTTQVFSSYESRHAPARSHLSAASTACNC